MSLNTSSNHTMDASSVTEFIANLPMVELHLHIEGSLEPEMMFSLAQRNGVTLPYADVGEISAAYEFADLQAFLDLYYQGMSVLQKEQDFYDLTWAYLQKMHHQQVRHVEIFWDPQGHTERGIPFAVAINGICRALEDGQQQFAISSGLIMCFLRHLSEEAAFETLQQAMPFLDKIQGVGLDSAELGHPPSKFARVFQRCGELGLKRVAHAGEEGPPEYVRDALDNLHIDRLDHGNRSLEDAELAALLADQGITLTVCPLSNLRLKNCPDLNKHPLNKMLELGIKATVNSDDPSYFGGYMNENYQAIADALTLDNATLGALANNAIDGSFASAERQVELRDELNAYLQQHDALA